MKITILDDVLASPTLSGDARRSFACPTACKLQNGDVLCLTRRGREKHSRDGVLMVQRSSDGGRTWSAPATIHDGMGLAVPESVHAGGICEGRDGTVFAMFTAVDAKDPEAYIFSETGRQLEQRFYVSRSADQGRTWSAPQQKAVPNTPPLRYLNCRPLLLPSGDFLVPVEVTTAAKQEEVLMARYSVQKQVFEPAIPCAYDPTGKLSFGDPKLLRMPDGRLLLWLWAFVTATEETVQTHVCWSSDEGRTWSRPAPTELCAQNSALLPQADGRVIAAGNVRVPPEGIRLWLSPDGGKSWEADTVGRLWDAPKQKVLGDVLRASQLAGKDTADGKLWDSLPGFTFGCPDLVDAAGANLLIYYVMVDGYALVRACRFTVV